MGNLTVNQVKAIVKDQKTGRHADGDGFYLMIPRIGRPYWMLRYTLFKKRKEVTIGKVDELSLADARLKASELRKQISKWMHISGLSDHPFRFKPITDSAIIRALLA